MQTLAIASAITAVGPTAGVQVRPSAPRMVVQVSISGGTARTAQIEAALKADGPWAAVGTSRTTVGEFIEDVPAAPHVRLNLSANTGSTVSAWVHADLPGDPR